MLLEIETEIVCVLRSERRLELRLVGKENILFTNLRVVWRLMRPSWYPHTQASLTEDTKECITLLTKKDLGNLNVIHKMILSHREDPKPEAEESRVELPNTMEPGTCLDLALGEKSTHVIDDCECEFSHSRGRSWPRGRLMSQRRRKSIWHS